MRALNCSAVSASCTSRNSTRESAAKAHRRAVRTHLVRHGGCLGLGRRRTRPTAAHLRAQDRRAKSGVKAFAAAHGPCEERGEHGLCGHPTRHVAHVKGAWQIMRGVNRPARLRRLGSSASGSRCIFGTCSQGRWSPGVKNWGSPQPVIGVKGAAAPSSHPPFLRLRLPAASSRPASSAVARFIAEVSRQPAGNQPSRVVQLPRDLSNL